MISNLLDVRCRLESFVLFEGGLIYNIESMLPESNSELVVTSERIELVGVTIIVQLFCVQVNP